MKGKIDLSVAYDREVDILYISLRNMENSYGDEDIDDFVTFRDMDTEMLTGYMVMNFKHYVESGELFKHIDYFESVSLKRVFEMLIEKEKCDWLKSYLEKVEK